MLLPNGIAVAGRWSVEKKSPLKPADAADFSNASSKAIARLSVASDSEISSEVKVGLGIRGAVAVVMVDEVDGLGWRGGDSGASGAGIADLLGSDLSSPQFGTAKSGLLAPRFWFVASSDRGGRLGGWRPRGKPLVFGKAPSIGA